MSQRSSLIAEIREETRQLLVLGGPVIAAQLAQISMNFVDTVMAGRLSPRDLAAVAVGGSLFMPVMIFGMGVLMSISPTIAHDFGAGKLTEIGRHVRQGLWLSLAASILSFILIRGCSWVLVWMDVEPEIIPTAIGYLNAVSWGLPAISAWVVLRSFTEAVSKTRPIMVISVIGLFTNIAANWVFMYGHFGMPALGAVGTGVGTAVTMWVMFILLAGWIAWEREYRRFAPFAHFETPNGRDLLMLVRLGTPIGVSLFMEVTMFAAVGLLMGQLGTEIVAGHQIALNVASVTFMVPLGISVAITVRTGQAMGRGDAHAARCSGFVGAGLAMGFMSLAALSMFLIPEYIATIYTDNSGVRTVACSLLFMAGIFQIFDGLQVSMAAALRGLKDTAFPMAITLCAYWAAGLPLAYGLGIRLGYGPQALWVGLIAGLVVAAILLTTRFFFTTRRLVAAREADDSVAGEMSPNTREPVGVGN